MPEVDGQALRAWRRARGWDVPALARQLRGVAGDDSLPVQDSLIRMIRRWERQGLGSERYELLYQALGFENAHDEPPGELLAADTDDAHDDAKRAMRWLTSTNVSDDGIEELDRAASYLAEMHSRIAAGNVLSQVLRMHRTVHGLLRDGKQRLRQSRDLLRIDSALLAHAGLLLGDLGNCADAREYGTAALASAQEAEADEGIAWGVMAKTARWQNRFAEAAGLARRGTDVCAQPSMRTELAYREANAAALLGDASRARAALQFAQLAAETLDDESISVWSFPPGRQAIFALSVHLHTGDPDSALRAAEDAIAYWQAGGAKATATWAQVKAGAAMAYLQKNSLDGAAHQLQPVLDLPPEQRIRTVTGYLDEADVMLRDKRFADSTVCIGLREHIREFNFVTSGHEASR